MSFIIVWMGTGVVLMKCEHTGKLALPIAMQQNDDCLVMQHEGCMSIIVSKLTPTNQVQSASFDFKPIQLLLLSLFVTVSSLLPLPIVAEERKKILSYKWHSPPRQYLNKLTILLI